MSRLIERSRSCLIAASRSGTGWSRRAFQNTSSSTTRSSHRFPCASSGTLNRSPDVTIAGAYLDQWAMVIAAAVTAWSGADYLARSTDALRS